jgi:hypothetical protein
MECHYQSWVSLVSQDNSTDRQADRVSWDSQNSSMDRRADRVSRDGNMKQNTGGSSKVANIESRVMENLANTESRLTENLAITESQVTQSLTNTESRVTKNSANMENWVMQDSGGGAGNRKKEKVLLQAKGWLHGGAQEVLPRHKNAECKRCAKESWPRKKKRKSRTIGLTVYGP